MRYEEAREYLNLISAKGNLLGLESIRVLLRELGNPQDRLKFIHVGGTNGKGSVAAYMEGALRQAGYKVGRYISPALFSYEERIQVNGDYITREAVARLATEIAKARSAIARRGEPESTIFEVETAMSFLYFLEQGCDLVLLEVGMGGREDATNIVTATVMEVLVSISMDHMEFLGSTLAEIAWNKAGIIKKHTPVVSWPQQPEALEVIRQVCEKQEASLSVLREEEITDRVYGLREQKFSYRGLELTIHLAGTCQMENAALAALALLTLREQGYPVSDEQIRRGFENTRWEGRFQILRENPAVVIDGAHNPDAARVLMEAVGKYFPHQKIYYIFGVFSDKEYDKIIEMTAPRAEWIYTVETKDNPRALPAEELALAVSKVNPRVTAVADVPRALDAALERASGEDVILVFGSLSFLWEAKQYFSEKSGNGQIKMKNRTDRSAL